MDKCLFSVNSNAMWKAVLGLLVLSCFESLAAVPKHEQVQVLEECHHNTTQDFRGHSGAIHCNDLSDAQSWRIAVAKNKTIRFSLRQFESLPCSNCSSGNCDSITIYDGRGANSSQISRMCSMEDGSAFDPITSSNVAFIHYEPSKGLSNYTRSFTLEFEDVELEILGLATAKGPDSGAKSVAIGVAIGTGVLVVIGIALGFYCHYYRSNSKSEYGMNQSERLQMGDVGETMPFQKRQSEGHDLAPVAFRRPTRHEIRMDESPQSKVSTESSSPSDVEEFVNDMVFELEYNHKELDIHKLRLYSEPIGIGAFGVSYKGTYRSGENFLQVAIKRMRRPNEGCRQALEAELKLLGHLHPHPYILDLVGGITNPTSELTVVAVYCELGSLQQYLRHFRAIDPSHSVTKCEPPNLSVGDMLYWAERVASGMQYIHSNNCVHRDLAARNILLTAEHVPKITGFGIGRTLNPAAFFDAKHSGEYAWKWAAIEVLEGDFFESKSDVWSFGVLMWEICSLGRRPFKGVNRLSEEFIEMIKDGARLPRPHAVIPNVLHTLMHQCWRIMPDDRPSFDELQQTLLSFRASY